MRIDVSEIERVFRDEYGRAVAVLTRAFGVIESAEDAVQDAFTVALQKWPATGLPPTPAGWIITTARNRAIDRLRREASRAAINEVHCDAPTADATDWWQILQLYNQLQVFTPTPVVAVNRAVAVAEVEGPDAALAVVDGLELDGYTMFHAIRADLLWRLGKHADAALDYEAAITRSRNASEIIFLQRRRAEVDKGRDHRRAFDPAG